MQKFGCIYLILLLSIDDLVVVPQYSGGTLKPIEMNSDWHVNYIACQRCSCYGYVNVFVGVLFRHFYKNRIENSVASLYPAVIVR